MNYPAAIARPAPQAVAQTRVPELRIAGLTKLFGSFAALTDVALEIWPGEFACFLGPSGCGKTTLLRAIAGLDVQTRGSILRGGDDISALPVHRRDFGIVFQSYALFPNLTVFGNVAYGLKSRRGRKAEIAARVRELLELVGLPEAADKYPAQLSGGQQQRVALARALAPSPGLLLLDEPLSALDARVRLRLRHEIKHLHRRLGLTTVMVTHDQEEALTMADRIVVMDRGRVEQVGTPLEIYRQPATRFVADFVGTMNVFTGTAVAPGRVRVGDLDLACDGPAGPAGAPVAVCIRPEDVVVRAVGPNAVNGVEARLDQIDFLGSFYRARLLLGDKAVDPLVTDLSVNAVRDLGLAVGVRLTIALPPDRLRVFAGA